MKPVNLSTNKYVNNACICSKNALPSQKLMVLVIPFGLDI